MVNFESNSRISFETQSLFIAISKEFPVLKLSVTVLVFGINFS